MIGSMSNVTLLKNLSAEDLARHIKRLAEDSGNVVFTNHARDRMSERKITFRHVIECLRFGRVIEGPYKSVKGDWKCTMVRAVSGIDISTSVAVNFDEELIIITVF